MKYFGIIYVITNLDNEKVYVGMTKHSLTKRMYGHMSYVNSSSNNMLIDIIMRNRNVHKYQYEDRFKDGYFVDNNNIKKFSVKVIDQGNSNEDLSNKEKYCIAQYKSYVGDYGTRFGYNQTRGGEFPFTGKESPLYKDIDRKLLRALIKKGYNREEIAKELGISMKTVSDKTKEFWEMNLVEAREHFNGEETYNERLKKRMSKSRQRHGFSEKWRKSASEKRKGVNNVRYITIDKNTLKSLIEEGLSVNEIAKILQINYTTVYAKMSEFWSKTSIIALRQQFDVEKPTRRRHVNKEALKEFLLKDFTIGEIASSFGVGKSTIYKRIKEYWGDRYHLDE